MTESSTSPSTAERAARVAIVTGASGGIGAASCARLGAQGYDVVVHYAGNQAKAEQAVAAVEGAGGRAVAIGADLGEEDDVVRLFDEAEQAFGGVDVVVNAAGIMILSPVATTSLEDFDSMMRINVRGAFLVSQQAARRLRSGGALINFSSSVTRLSPPTYAAYAGTKGFVEALTPILAKELGERDVTVSTVAPGPTATPLFLDGKPQEVIDTMAAMNPLGRIGEPDDIAETVAFLAGPARWINGQTVFANGGVA